MVQASPSARRAGTPTTSSSDANRKRVYVICGAGFIDVFDAAESYRRIARISTVSGARTGLFIPSLDLLALGLRASGNEPAAIWLYRATP